MLTLDYVMSKSANRLSGLHPVVKAAAERLIGETFAKGVPIVITQGLRTIAEQDELYAQGRTKPGQIVTNAKGGYSNHNFGMAIDFALLLPDGKNVSWDMKRDGNGSGTADWYDVVAVAKVLGFAWGGDWNSFKDYPHFEMTFGLSTAQYRAGKRPTQAQIDAAYKIINKDVDEVKREEFEALEKRITKLEEDNKLVPAPKWFVSEFGSADLKGMIADPQLTVEGWRTLAISLRASKK